jgi:hypothetical protein
MNKHKKDSQEQQDRQTKSCSGEPKPTCPGAAASRLRDRGLGLLSLTDILPAEKEVLLACSATCRDSASAVLAAPLARPTTS